ncbi:MAG: 1-(5-phosphoribosyl)-5-[(5-phosphoribosylamino)methylideneamino]imidazole-4-carboxamide isomerase [Spirochaetales bacterium]|nr:1-(5-phosphoribosyl)-5-[(5-phosphoribosylamino)methylideneamino]imidazole-4-carboxamide isomerase [Spirochaetales bacterium]
MKILPAIDMLDGACVRLHKGRYDEETKYFDDPVAVAKSFEDAGAEVIHLVDLNAAAGRGHNREIIAKIGKAVRCRLELGGGVRTGDDVQQLIDAGVHRVILGTILVKDPELSAKMISDYKKYVDFIAGIDALHGEVKVSGWEKGSGVHDGDLAQKVKAMGCAGIVYTNIDKDGTLSGPDIENTVRIGQASNLPVIVSGGISSLADIEAVCTQAGDKVWGIITGKAIYENKFTVREAVELVKKFF